MVLVGGATRLTDSGLSITEWKPIHGVIPPLTAADWQEEFDKYRQIPEYQVINKGMTLDEFKTIFWWEWGHRLLGRVIGLAYFLPLAWFWARGRVEPWLKPRLAAGFVLGGLQGAIGWWMVTSGLVDRVDVSQYRLAIHLTLACVILAYLFWIARVLKQAAGEESLRAGGRGQFIGAAWLLLLLVFVQIFLGGLVAGLDAGMGYNTWPLMDGQFVPDGLLIMQPAWVNLFENAMTVQFQHRMTAYALIAVAAVVAFAAPASVRRIAAYVAVAVLVQAALGVAALLTQVRFDAALTHQGFAL